MDKNDQIKKWISEDPMRMEALSMASDLGLSDWCLAAGFVRNLAWDKVHGYSHATALNDIDLIYFDSSNTHEEIDRELEQRLKARSDFPWSVKNQARMHTRNSDNPYGSTEDAMSYWVEVETAVGATLTGRREIDIIAPFGIEVLFDNTITLNSKRSKPGAFAHRMREKKWLEIWPKLAVSG